MATGPRIGLKTNTNAIALYRKCGILSPSTREMDMTFIDETSGRADLEIAAIFDCGMDCASVEKATDSELLAMIRSWIEAGDECAAA